MDTQLISKSLRLGKYGKMDCIQNIFNMTGVEQECCDLTDWAYEYPCHERGRSVALPNITVNTAWQL
jgi:hypothetical protein